MKHLSILLIFAISFTSCKESTEAKKKDTSADTSCTLICEDTPSRFTTKTDSPKDMVWIPSSELMMDTNEKDVHKPEKPTLPVCVKSFLMDTAEVTDTQFKKFIDTANYITTAEKKPDWEDLKKQLPTNIPKPSEKELFPASSVYVPPNSSINNRMNHPVVDIAYRDVPAYCKWV